ncbi:MAG: hypothetical protein MPW14_20210 [Candidatus Manganitrophus sp.]|nr:hypothetical protein [Candidatus Manganitrophus sp.]MDC4225615.1 hypothetical protein [Candidatus Manganitrophus sp.]WDT73034.1 MAG: hypothetical protein MPW17_09400 [Candidatus Manganitrophus sp.]WDT74757.1 MAG: hypothetical protein MPW16_16015 [Candidatus Manganitrophus sp.]WDT79439.1 MAG: hypothetical protein MPW14_20210 [Candidatus Manganitrophus sp.]
MNVFCSALSAALLGAVLFFGFNEAKAASRDSLRIVAPAVAYHPRGFVPGTKGSVLNREQIVEDLRLLKRSGFRSLVTYSAEGMQRLIPEIARSEGFDGTIIMGVWNPLSEEEIRNAVAQAPFVDAYCVGNEGLGVRYTPEQLAKKMDQLRLLTSRPVTTTEPIDSYLAGPYRNWLIDHSDWLFPLAQPVWFGQSDPLQSVRWISARHDFLTATTGRRVILKEAALPSAGAEAHNEENQLSFFKALELTGMRFFYFEAFDQPWKKDFRGEPGIEIHWGLFHSDGTPKKVVSWLIEHRMTRR